MVGTRTSALEVLIDANTRNWVENHIASLITPLQEQLQNMSADMYGYCKYHKKRAKTGQKRTRERKECTRAGTVEEEQNQPEVMQELLLKLMKDLQILNGIQPNQEEQTEQEEPTA
ncbi:hypothetical protein Tco_1122399 [Tanacetum coccineum]|uniref:Uncharacterized protein n=1 Tax=Tanacetum coccineum TaxID=301880 RepID=A0ABQ5J453_9ASTR